MAARRFFQVVDGPLTVRAEPGTRAATVGKLLAGAVIEVAPDSQRSVDGFIWWRHALGWTAERSEEDGIILMQSVAETLADLDTEPTHYRVIDGPLYIRADPHASSQRIGELKQDEIVAVFPETRCADGGLMWVQHLRGWTAIGKVDGSAVFMEPSLPPEPLAPPSAEPASDADALVHLAQSAVGLPGLEALFALPETRFFRVVMPSVAVRTLPNPASPVIGQLAQDTIIEVYPGSRTVGGAYIFWQHNLGWSAESRADGLEVQMLGIVALDELPDMSQLPLNQQPPVTPEAPTVKAPTIPNHFRVVKGPLYVLVGPSINSTPSGMLYEGEIVEIVPGSRTVANGYIWWQHQLGWSAQMSVAGETFMAPESADAPAEPPASVPPVPVTPVNPKLVIFEVIAGPISIRAEPATDAEILGELQQGITIEVQRASRTPSDGLVWWQHHLGWSVQKDTQTGEHFMQRVDAMKNPPLPAPGTMPDGSAIRYFEVTGGPISVRSGPDTTSERVGLLYNREQIQVDPDSRTVAGQLVWWHHAQGWSAERTVIAGSVPFMTAIEKLTLPPSVGGLAIFPIFELHPVDLRDVQWIQYFGNTTFAYKLRQDLVTWYNYSQGLHGGVDYGTSRAVPILAGVEGTVLDVYRNTRTYAPNFCRIRVGPFMVIYGHIARPVSFRAGQVVRPETVVGTIDAGGQNHTHLEVRYQNKIINPLLLMPEDLRNQITNRWIDLPKHFYRDPSWTAWQTPLDQPVLTLQSKIGARIIGPHTGRLE